VSVPENTPAEEAPVESDVTLSDAAPAPPAEPAPALPDEAPDDADDLRGYHFRLLMGRKVTWIIIGILILVSGIAAAIFLGPAIGGVAAVAVLLLSLLAVFALADSKAEDSFFEHYAKQNGMTLSGRGALPEATPLLQKGDDRYAERALAGDLAPGVNGVLALYTYEEETTDSKGNRQTSYYRYTVGLVQVLECIDFIPELYVQRKFGLRALEKFEDAFRGSKERVKLESEELDKRYEIFVDEKQDQNWLRQLFAPTFIVWLLQKTPDRFAFEMVNGTLCCYANSHKKKAADLDRMRAATAAVATRLREESLE
jgi:hypothetical protein